MFLKAAFRLKVKKQKKKSKSELKEKSLLEKFLLSLLIKLELNFTLTQDLLNRIGVWATGHSMEFPGFLLRRHLRT